MMLHNYNNCIFFTIIMGSYSKALVLLPLSYLSIALPELASHKLCMYSTVGQSESRLNEKDTICLHWEYCAGWKRLAKGKRTFQGFICKMSCLQYVTKFCVNVLSIYIVLHVLQVTFPTFTLLYASAWLCMMSACILCTACCKVMIV